jgi:hypothetical protein
MKLAFGKSTKNEADALDYQTRFGRPASYFDGNLPYRSSDHSPVVVGLKGVTPFPMFRRRKKPKTDIKTM